MVDDFYNGRKFENILYIIVKDNTSDKQQTYIYSNLYGLRYKILPNKKQITKFYFDQQFHQTQTIMYLRLQAEENVLITQLLPAEYKSVDTNYDS